MFVLHVQICTLCILSSLQVAYCVHSSSEVSEICIAGSCTNKVVTHGNAQVHSS